jgi:molecular chaperone IbpA
VTGTPAGSRRNETGAGGFDRLFDVLDEVQRTAEEMTVEQNVLTLEGRKSEKEEKAFLHRAISARNFKRQFTLADHVEVKGARFENGLLVIDLQREIPEAIKPRRIAINGAAPNNVTQIEAKAA